MKITKTVLKDLIREEIKKSLSEGIGPGGSFIGRNASAGRRHPGGYGSRGSPNEAEAEYNEILNSKASLQTSDFEKVTLLQNFIEKYENAPTEDRAGNWVYYAKRDLEDIKKRIERSGSPVGKMANWVGDQGKKLAVGLGIKEETATTKKTVKVKIKKKVEENEEWDKQDAGGPGGGVTTGTKERLKKKYGRAEPQKKAYDWKQSGGLDPESF
jgi:hypothetical protein